MESSARVACVGLDCHKMFSRVTARGADQQVLWRGRWEHRDRPKLRNILHQLPRQTPVVLEGTFGWAWIADELEAAGLTPYLASSRKVAAWRKARGLAKCNRLDADLLSELPGERSRWWAIWLPPPAVRQQREWLRYRMTLVRTQTGLKNRVHALLHQHGIILDVSDIFGAAGRRALQRLSGPGATRLPAETQLILRGYLQLLDHVRRQIAAVTRTVHRQVTQSSIAERLRQLPGISYILAHTIAAEVGDFARFATARQLASYSLLAPRANESGNEDETHPLGRRLGYAGRRTLKWAWLEAAHGAVRSGGFWRQYFDGHTDGGTRNRQRGYIRVAHRLCSVAFACQRKQTDYQPEPPPRPRARRRRPAIEAALAPAKPQGRAAKRPGVGQPNRPMVAADR